MEADLYQMLSEHFQSIAGNIEEYVRDFLRIYRESDREANAQKQINELRTQLTKEKNKREKLLDLYTEGDISRDEFRERKEAMIAGLNKFLRVYYGKVMELYSET